MKLQNGFELEGIISNTMIEINGNWTKVLIIETMINVQQAMELFKSNSIIIDTKETIEIIYNTNGLIDIKTDNGKSYIWMYFGYSTISETIQPFKTQIENLTKQISDININLANIIGGM